MTKSACNVEGCSRKHHTLLHFPLSEPSTAIKSTTGNTIQAFQDSPDASSPGVTADESTVGNHNISPTMAGVYLRVIPVIVSGPDGEVETLALLDEGSQITLCSKKLADRIGLQGEKSSLRMRTLNAVKEVSCMVANIKVKSIKRDEEIDVQVTSLDDMPVSCSSPSSSDISSYDYLQGIDFNLPSPNQEVTLLIGADVPEVFWVLEERRGGRKQPFAIRSLLGWTLMGPATSKTVTDASMHHISVHDDPLMEQVRKFWETDFSDGKCAGVAESVEDRRAREIMENTLTMVNGHYMMGLPWRFPDSYLPNNRQVALLRLRNMKRKFVRDAEMFQKYKAVIHDYLDKGYAQKVPQEHSSEII